LESVIYEQVFDAGPAGKATDSSEQALNIAQAPAANKELSKTFFIIFLFTPRLKLDFIPTKGTKKSFLKAVM
jgi:hypothetical protein